MMWDVREKTETEINTLKQKITSEFPEIKESDFTFDEAIILN